MSKTYQIKISKEGEPLLFITQDNQIQIETSISFYDIANSSNFNTLTLYNLSSNTNLKKFQNAEIEVLAGFEKNGVLDLQGIDTKKTNTTLILKGKIFDLIQDFTNPPDRKFIFRIAPFSYDDNTSTNEKENEIIVFKKNTSFFDFANDTLKRFANIELVALSDSLKTIKNTTQDLNFVFNPKKNDILNSLNDFIVTNSKSLKNPLSLTYSQLGIMLTYDFLNTSNKEFIDNIKKDLSSIKDNFVITENLLLAPPTRPNINELEIQTILLPKVRVGSILQIEKNLVFNDTARKTPYLEGIQGTYYVRANNIILNYADSNPLSWSNLFSLVKIF